MTSPSSGRTQKTPLPTTPTLPPPPRSRRELKPKERAVLDVLKRLEQATARDVYYALDRQFTLTTVRSHLSHLSRRGIIEHVGTRLITENRSEGRDAHNIYRATHG